MSADIHEYLTVGRRSATTLREIFTDAGLDDARPARVLDFGCGLARTLRWLVAETSWELQGCDVDAASIEWSATSFPALELRRTESQPPLPYPDASFDAIYAVSVFTHFEEAEQTAWGRELTRILAPGGLLAISSMGPRALGAFPDLATPGHRETLEAEGFLFVHPRGATFNSRGAFHLESGLRRLVAGDELTLAWWREGGLDGFQDLSLFERSRS